MTANDYNLDVETQRRIEYTKQKLLKIDQLGEQLRKLKRANRNSEEKLERLIKRKESLELDIARLADSSMRAEPEVAAELLHSIEEPMDMDMIYGEAFRVKMCHLNVLLNEIIVRTSMNEKAMCKEIGHQEGEFENRLKEAIYGRSLLNREVQEAQTRCESVMREQASVYEEVRELEENIEKFDASRWLLNVEKRRVSDILDRTKREPKSGVDPRKAYIVPCENSSIEELVKSTASLTHEHSLNSISESSYATSIETPILVNPPNTLADVVPQMIHLQHKERCPKRNKNIHSIPQSAVSHASSKVPSKTRGAKTLNLNGNSFLDFITKIIQEELDGKTEQN